MAVTPRPPEGFQHWKTIFPALESKVSSVGNLFFLRWKFYFPRLESFLENVSHVLFLKKVHSWEGITEMVLGSFLLVL